MWVDPKGPLEDDDLIASDEDGITEAKIFKNRNIYITQM